MDIQTFLLKKLNNDVFSIIKEYLTIDDKIINKIYSKLKIKKVDFRNDYNYVYSYKILRVFNEEIKIRIKDTDKYMIFNYRHFY